jgi:hypothetical protein
MHIESIWVKITQRRKEIGRGKNTLSSRRLN